MTISDEIVDLVREYTGDEIVLNDDDNILDLTGMEGDDVSEFLEMYSEKFGVNMDAYLWYFHHGEGGWPGLGGLFFRPPNDRVETIPITLRILDEGARAGRWPAQYPAHTLPKRRYDIIVNQIFGLTVLVSLGVWIVDRF